MTSLGTWGLPQMISRFYTIKDEKSIPVAKIVSTIFALIITSGAYIMGAFSRLIIEAENGAPAIMKDGVLTSITYDQIVPHVLSRTLPTIVLAIILIVILAASMSTLSSIVLASSTTFVMDLLKPLYKEKLNEKRTMIALRICGFVFVVFSYLLAIGNSPILSLNALSWGVVSGCLFAPYVLGLYYKRITKKGVYAGILSAMLIMIFGVIQFGINSAMITTVSAAAILLPNLVVLVVSLVTEKLEQTHITYIFKKNETEANIE